MSERVLFVDDDANILAAFERQLRKQFELVTARGGQEGLAAVADRGPFAVIISDMRMPEMDGVQFLTQVRTMAPDSVRMMLTGNADQATAIAAVNQGHIFRFLNKPCPADILADAIRAGLQQYRLVLAEKELLERTLRGSLKVLADVLALTSPTAFGRSARIRRLVERLAGALGLPMTWQLDVAAMLSQLGCVAVPEPILKKGQSGEPLTPDEARLLASHPRIGHDLLVNIPRLEAVALAIADQDRPFDGSGLPPDDRRGTDIPIEARILKVAIDFDFLQAKLGSRFVALEQMKQRGGKYDPAVLDALMNVLHAAADLKLKEVSFQELSYRMLLAEDLRGKNGLMLVAQGQEVTPAMFERLRYFARNVGLREPIRVLVPAE
jgi:response regulator RpfG family c-di-GMP phosphodiesterase